MQALQFPGIGQDGAAEGRRPRLLRAITTGGWIVVLSLSLISVIHNPSTGNIVTVVAFLLLFLAVNAEWIVARWAHHRRWRRLSAKILGAGYISDLHDLPNRNYLLTELRREISGARSNAAPFTLIQLSFDTADAVRKRRGDDFMNRATNAIVDVLQRVTRDCDFVAYLGGSRFVVLLNEADRESAYAYLKRIPGAVAVSDGRRMLEVPVAARMYEYDMESVYATDILAELESSPAMRRKQKANDDRHVELA